MSAKHIVCYSGGHSSALVAIEVVRAMGKDNVILLNHDIHPDSEEQDVKRFKIAVAEYLGMPITYANHPNWDTKDQFDVVMEAGAFKVDKGPELCTNRLKTAPFFDYLEHEHPEKDVIVYYGFDANEMHRVQRRVGIMGQKGYRTEYPLVFWQRTILSTREVGIEPPMQYAQFKHANCIGCLKAGLQHWYVVYCTRPDRWEKAKHAEDEIGYSIHAEGFLEDYEEMFAQMRQAGIPATEHIPHQRFFNQAKKIIKVLPMFEAAKPCECIF